VARRTRAVLSSRRAPRPGATGWIGSLLLPLLLAACGATRGRPVAEIIDLSPRFSPAGDRVVFASDRDGAADLYLVDVAGGEPERLTDTPGTEADPAFAPDGSIVHVYRQGDTGAWSLRRLDDGRISEILGGPTSSAFPDVSSAGEVVMACVAGRSFAICTVDLTGGEAAVVFDDPAARDWQPVWSPDGAAVAFVSDADGDDEIYVLTRDGAPLRLTDNDAKDADPAWSPDGGRIAFSSDRDGSSGIWIMDAAGTDARRIADGTKPAWSPDGRRLAHHAAARLPDLGVAIAITDLESGTTEIVSRDG